MWGFLGQAQRAGVTHRVSLDLLSSSLSESRTCLIYVEQHILAIDKAKLASFWKRWR